MTDKELRKLRRADLLEILFYLQKELDELRSENESLKARVDDLLKAAMSSKTELSEECMLEITRAVKNAAESVFSGQNQEESGEKSKEQDESEKDGKKQEKSEEGGEEPDGTEQ